MQLAVSLDCLDVTQTRSLIPTSCMQLRAVSRSELERAPEERQRLTRHDRLALRVQLAQTESLLERAAAAVAAAAAATAAARGSRFERSQSRADAGWLKSNWVGGDGRTSERAGLQRSKADKASEPRARAG